MSSMQVLYIGIKRFFACLSIFFLLSILTYAQNTENKESDYMVTVESDDARKIDFNAYDSLMISRHKPDYSLFSKTHFYDNMFVSLYGGVAGVFNRGSVDIDAGYHAGLSLSKYFNPYSGLRLSLAFSGMMNNVLEERMKIFNLSADYIFNITNFINDFDRRRFFNIASIQGVGFDRTSAGNSKGNSFDFHWGLMLKFNIFSRFNIYMEPRFYVMSDNFDLVSNNHHYDIGYNTIWGVNYAFGNVYKDLEYLSRYRGWDGVFLGFTGGVQSLLGASGNGIDFPHSLGPALSVTFGKWFLPFSGLKMSLYGSGNPYSRLNNSYNARLAVYGGARAEVMMDLLAISKKTRSSKFGIVPSIGMEYGIYLKQASEHTRTNYIGATAAMQFKYKLEPDLAFYIEPRISVVPFYYYNDGENFGDSSLKDKVLSVNFGVETTHFGKIVKNGNVLIRENDGFTPHFIFSASMGGAMVVQQMHSIERDMSHMANIGLGYWFNSVSGLRLDGNLGTVMTRMPSRLSQINISASLNYTFNVLNFVSGYDSSRLWDAELFLGPMLGVANETSAGNGMLPGVQGGGRLSLRLPYSFDFYVEPRMHLYAGRFFPSGSGSPAVAGINFGGTYHFGWNGNRGDVRNSNNSCFLDNTFMGVTMGAVNSIGTLLSGAYDVNDKLTSSGAEYSFYLGKWLAPYIGMKASTYADFYSYYISNVYGKPDRTAVNAGVGLEFMLNPFRFRNSEQVYPVELVPTIGIRAGRYYKQMSGGSLAKFNATSFTAGLQIRYSLLENLAIVLEPRIMRSPYNESVRKERLMKRNNLLSLNIGVEMTHSRDAQHTGVASARKNYEKHWFASASVGFDNRVTSARYGKFNTGVIAGVSGGYSFTPFSSLRLGYDYGYIPSALKGRLEHRSHNISADYILGISNIVSGYDRDNRFGFSLFGGPVFTVTESRDWYSRFGFEGGAIGTVRVSPSVDIFVQPRARAYASYEKDDMVRGRELFFDLSAGLTYKF